MNSGPPVLAAVRRLGPTSVEHIDREMSIASRMVAAEDDTS